MDKPQCKSCGAENKESANFCVRCGTRLKETCDCWIKKKPYNCGQGKCPGYRLSIIEDETNNQRVLTSAKLGDIGLKASKLAGPTRERRLDKDL